MIVNARITANVNLRLHFSTDLLADYENQPNPQQANIRAFLDAVAQPGGPVDAAFQYLRAGHHLPQGMV